MPTEAGMEKGLLGWMRRWKDLREDIGLVVRGDRVCMLVA